METHQNSILRGQELLSTRGDWKRHAAFLHLQLELKQSRRQKSAVHEQRQEKAVKRSSTVVAVFKFDRCLDHWDRDVCPTRPTIQEASREKPPTSTTTTGRTIMETIQRERPATSPTTARDQTPTTAAPQPGAARREATSGVPVLRPQEGESAVLTSEEPQAAVAPVPAWIAVLGNFLRQLIFTKLDQALEGRIQAALPQLWQQAGTSDQPPSLQPASTNAQGILLFQPHQYLPPQHCQGGSEEDNNIRHSNSNSRSNNTSITNHSNIIKIKRGVSRVRNSSIRHSSPSRGSSRARIPGFYRW